MFYFRISPFLIYFINTMTFSYSFHIRKNIVNSTFHRFQQHEPKQIGKRNAVFYELEKEICPTVQKWMSFSEGKTIEDKTVEIVQDERLGKQWFYVVKCSDEYENRSCRLIDHEQYQTKCTTRYNLVPAVVWGPNKLPDWTMIRMPSQCVCVEIQNEPFNYQ